MSKHDLTCFCKGCVDEALAEDLGLVRESDDQWRSRQFLQAAGEIWQLIPSQTIRTWASKYAVWLKEREVENVTRQAPTVDTEWLRHEDVPKVVHIKVQLDKLAKKFFRGEKQ